MTAGALAQHRAPLRTLAHVCASTRALAGWPARKPGPAYSRTARGAHQKQARVGNAHPQARPQVVYELGEVGQLGADGGEGIWMRGQSPAAWTPNSLASTHITQRAIACRRPSRHTLSSCCHAMQAEQMSMATPWTLTLSECATVLRMTISICGQHSNGWRGEGAWACACAG